MSKPTVKVKALNVWTLNVQGCREESKQQTILEDALGCDLQVIGLTETHVIDELTTTITVKRTNTIKRTYKLFFGGIKDKNTFSGTGIAIESSLRPRFKRIKDRIVTASFQLDETRKANVIVAYAPTLSRSEKDPQLREVFYSEQEKITSQHVKDKHFLLVMGDFNAKTGSGHYGGTSELQR